MVELHNKYTPIELCRKSLDYTAEHISLAIARIQNGDRVVIVANANYPPLKINMKTYNNLWEKFITKENFELAYINSIKRKSKQQSVREFKKNKEENLENIRKSVANGEFHTSSYREKIVYEPKQRIVYKLPYSPDRIVQHAIMNVLKPILLNLLIENSFACIEGRGQIKASQKCSQFVRKYKYCLKCDIRKFYPSINQNILSEKLQRIIKDKRFMEILNDIIFSFEGGYNCPIGNYCSQWFGNYYLSFLDNFVLHKLKCKAYLRFCDDFLLFSNDKSYLQDCKRKIKEFINTKLDLDYSKSEVFDTKQGVDFCGYRHFGTYVLVRKSTVKRMKRRSRNNEELIKNNTYDEKHILGQIASDNGILKHSNGYNLRKTLNIDNQKQQVIERRDNNGNRKISK